MFKIMLVGDSWVGKTCLLMRFKNSKGFLRNTISTVGIDYQIKELKIGENKLKFQIWDTAGQERFRSITRAYYREAHAILLVFDLTSIDSFFNVKAWLNSVKQFAKSQVILMLVGNKRDMEQERSVSATDAENVAKEFSIEYVETSAKTGHYVDETFTLIAQKVHAQFSETFSPSKLSSPLSSISTTSQIVASSDPLNASQPPLSDTLNSSASSGNKVSITSETLSNSNPERAKCC